MLITHGLRGETTIDSLDGNGLLKTYAFSIEDKMAAGAFGRARSYGSDGLLSTEVDKGRTIRKVMGEGGARTPQKVMQGKIAETSSQEGKGKTSCTRDGQKKTFKMPLTREGRGA